MHLVGAQQTENIPQRGEINKRHFHENTEWDAPSVAAYILLPPTASFVMHGDPPRQIVHISPKSRTAAKRRKALARLIVWERKGFTLPRNQGNMQGLLS